MGHGHGHGHGSHTSERNVLLSVLLNLIITIAEFVGGFMSNSLALLSDALHNLSDTIAIAISYIALRLGKKPSTEKNTFGFKRYEILAALFNASVLVAISLFLFWEAYERFLDPQPIRAGLMLIVATIGLFANLFSILLLHRDRSHNLNIRSAYLHLLGDTFSSVGVLAGGAAMYFWQWYWVDPLVTVLVGVFIIKHAIDVILETVNILVMATPANVDLQAIKCRIEENEAVANVHHMHSWQLHDNAIHFECHIDLKENILLKNADAVRKSLEELLLSNFGIHHTTIQMEYDCCATKELIHQ